MGNSNSQELSQKVERHETAINTTQAHGITMSLQLNENIAKIQEQLDILEARFETYLTKHKGEHTELSTTLKLLQEEIRQLQVDMKRPQPQPGPVRLYTQATERPDAPRNTRPLPQEPPGRVRRGRDVPQNAIVDELPRDDTLPTGAQQRMQSIQAKAGTLMLHLLAHEALDIKTDKSFPGYQQKYKSMKSSYHVDTSPLYEFNS